MADGVVVLNCPNCGAKLEITPEIDRFVCIHCGTQEIVKRSGGIVSIQPLVEGMSRIQQGTDKTAAELAIRRLTEEIAAAKSTPLEVDSRKPNQIIPPSWKERSLPWIGITLIALGVYGVALDSPFQFCGCILLGIIAFAMQAWIRRNRMMEVNLAKGYAAIDREANIEKLELDLAENRRIVSS